MFNESQYSGYPDNSATSNLGYIETDNPYSINPASNLAQNCINMGADEGETLKTTYGITEDIAGAGTPASAACATTLRHAGTSASTVFLK